MLKTLQKFSWSLFVATILCAGAYGDTVVLTSGEKLEGKILKETDAEITIETRAGGIVDERTVKRSEIANIGKAAPDEAPWQALRNLKLGDNSLPVSQYDSYLGPLKAFLTQYPESKYKPDAEKMVAEFEAEKQRIAGGERKLSGKWLSKEEVQRESYQINGAVALNFMREQSARNDAVGALNAFDLLERQYPGSRAYIDGVDQAKRLIPALKQQAEARLARLPAEMADRQKAVQLARAADKAQVAAELEREKQNNATALAQAKQQNRKWPPFLPSSEESLQQIVQLATEEGRRVAAIDLSKPRESIRLAEQVKAALAKKDIPTAEENLKKAQEAWSQNEMLPRIDAELIAARDAAPKEAATATTETTSDETRTADAADGSTGSASSSSATDDEPKNPFFRVVIGVVILVLLYVAWKAYSSIRKKANEVIE